MSQEKIGDVDEIDQMMANKAKEIEFFAERSEFDDESDKLYMANGKNALDQRRVYRKVIIIERSQPVGEIMIRWLVSVAMYAFIIQTIFTVWKKVSSRTHDICVFLILMFFPPAFFVYARSYFLPGIWAGFMGFILISCFKMLKSQHDKEAMRRTYAIFKRLFIISNSGIFVGQALTFITFYVGTKYLMHSLSVLLFFVYFGLLSRETIFFLSEMMAVSTGFYSKEGVPGKGNNNSLCMICTKRFDGVEKIHTLGCGHSFHEDCIKGWCLLGKKLFCPYCKSRVVGSTLPPELWHKAEVWFYPLINTMRSFIIITLMLTGIVLYKIRYQNGQ
ncbi:hypothetical protein HK407_03g06020 [Ordospora pajunii]|uniref:uncharacterized protein n=1 Tax=Ordospora pajunii TaxID=3039483 RepID=UPI00295275FC|nr:uncharacterized protein HK407_03g06020 [Ordospora pajunii]KAH9411850.1 hypothetical protein HK407_03g06020 [Ordospora pajunii]